MIAAYDARKKTHELYVLSPLVSGYFWGCSGRAASGQERDREVRFDEIACRVLKEIAKMIYAS